jgi:hypothetical protein
LRKLRVEIIQSNKPKLPSLHLRSRVPCVGQVSILANHIVRKQYTKKKSHSKGSDMPDKQTILIIVMLGVCFSAFLALAIYMGVGTRQPTPGGAELLAEANTIAASAVAAEAAVATFAAVATLKAPPAPKNPEAEETSLFYALVGAEQET